MSDPFADLIPPPSFKNVVGGGPSDPVFNREDPFSDLMPLKSGASSSAPRPLMSAPEDNGVLSHIGGLWDRNAGALVQAAGGALQAAGELPTEAMNYLQDAGSAFGALKGNPYGAMNLPEQAAAEMEARHALLDSNPNALAQVGRDIAATGEGQLYGGSQASQVRRPDSIIDEPLQAAKYYANEAAGSAVPMAIAVAAPEVGLPLFGAQAFGGEYDKRRAQGVSPLDAAASGSLHAAAEVIPESAALKVITGRLGSAAKSALGARVASAIENPLIRAPAGAIAEGGSEVATQIAQDATDRAMGDDISIAQMGQNAKDAFLAGGILGGPLAGIHAAAEHLAERAPNSGATRLVNELARQAPKTPEEHAVQTGSDIVNKIFEETGASSPAPNAPELIQPNAPPRSFVPDSQTAPPSVEEVNAAAKSVLAALDKKANGTPDSEMTGPDGKPVKIRGGQGSYLTPEEIEIRKFLTENINNPDALSKRFNGGKTVQGSAKPAESPVLTGEPEIINNGKRVFYPGDTTAMRAKLEAAGLNPGMRKVGENGEDLGLYFPATMRADVDAVLRSAPVRAQETAAPVAVEQSPNIGTGIETKSDRNGEYLSVSNGEGTPEVRVSHSNSGVYSRAIFDSGKRSDTVLNKEGDFVDAKEIARNPGEFTGDENIAWTGSPENRQFVVEQKSLSESLSDDHYKARGQIIKDLVTGKIDLAEASKRTAELRASKPSADMVAQAEPVVKPDAPVASPVVEQSTPAPYEGAKLPPERKPRNQVRTAADFDPNYHDIRDFIALNGGLDFGAFKSEFNSEIPGDNMRFFGKPLFRKKGGMKPDQLRELMQESGFLNQDSPDAPPQYTPQDAYDLVDRALDGEPVYHSDGVDTQNQIRADNEYYAEQSRRQDYIDEHGVAPELDEEFAQRASALDRGDLERMYSRRDTATGDMFGASQRSPDTSPRPAQTGLFAEPTANERNTAESAKRDAERNGLGRDLVQPSQGKGDLFAGPRPKQDVLKSQLEVPKKIRDFKTDEGQFSTYDIDSNPRGRSEMFTVQKSKDGYVVRNALVPDAMQRKGIAAKFYRDMNRESLEKTGNPLRSTAPRTLSDGRVVHELSPDAVGLWDSLVKGGVAEKTGDRAYQFKSNEIKRSQRPDTQGIEVDEATDLTPDEMAAFQRQTEPKKPERTRPDTPIIADDSVTTGLTGIARNDDAFKHPTSKKMDVADIFRDIEPDYTLSKSVEMAEANETPADTAWRITTPEGDKAALYQKGNKIWVDVSDLKQGQGGSRIYNAVANYAHNNGKVFIGDPAGLSEIAQKRRAEQMLSSALKFGTTDHMQPHPKQLQGNQELGIPKLNWKVGDTAHNIRELAKVTSEVTTKEFGEIADLTYNPETLRFERPDGREVTDADFKALAAQKRAGRDSSQSGSGKDGVVQPAPTAGVTTLKRAIIARQLASPDGGKLAGVLAGVSGRGAEHPAGKSLPNLGRVLYSRRDQTETPEFKKWFGDSKTVDADGAPTLLYRGEGKNVQREIMDSSKSRDKAVFLTPDKKIASIYSDGKEPFSYYVKADKLLDLTQDSREARDFINEWAKEYDDWTDRQSGEPIDPVDAVQSGMLFDYEGDWSSERWNSLQEAALQDHDAAYLPDYDSSSGVFKSLITKGGANIKSATGNNGDFDTTNPSILKSESAKPATEKPAAKESPEQAAAKNAAAEKTVAKTLGRSEIKRLKDKGNLKFLTTAQVMELGINGAKSQSDLKGVDGFYHAQSGNVYIISDSGINPDGLAGVVVHELVHSNMEAFLGTEGFQKLLRAFVHQAKTDPVAKAALAHARKVDKGKSEALQQEEGLSYFGQTNPDHPLTKRLVDEGKLFLNRLGVPLTWLNANNAALRKIIALNLKDAQYRDRSHSIGKGGVKYQRVFHGTPHRDIEKTGFSLQKIGTGEGAQAYGFGMYFAGNKDIAEYYRQQLSNPRSSYIGEYPDDYMVSEAIGSILNGLNDGKSFSAAKADAVEKARRQLGDSEYPGHKELRKKKIEAIQAIPASDFDITNQGQLYHAEIPEDSDLLDYDKPLSEQPEKVRAALREHMPNIPDHVTGRDVYASLRYGEPASFDADGRALFDGAKALGAPVDSAKAASEYLSSIGIPGLRYLDGTSRAADWYVSPPAHTAAGKWMVKDRSKPDSKGLFFDNEADARADIAKRQQGNSHNYVIWDENLLTPEKAQITPYYSKRVDDTPQTETENFKRWFWGSEVVDAAGKPLMVYHGTPDASFAGSGGAGVFRTARESIGLPHSTRAFFFSSDSRVAQTYATGPAAGASPGVVQVYLSLKNPMVFDAKGADWSSTKNQIEMAQAAGADGVIIKNVRDDYTVTDDNKKQMTTTVYVAFRPEQIKSATGNNGQFDPSNPSILFSKRVDDTEREKNFAEAFKDTKVVGEDGKPLRVYHGTTGDFDTFDSGKQGSVTRSTSSKSGFFFTDSPRTAKSYADHGATVSPVERLIAEADKAGDKGDWDTYDQKIAEAEELEAKMSKGSDGRNRGQSLIPVYLDIKNPLVIDAKGENPQGIGGIDPLIQKAKKAGNDGVIIKNFDDSAGLSDDASTHYIAFKPEQIKSAVGNSGAFDMSKPSILASKRTYTPEQEEFLRKGGQAAPKGRLAALGESLRDRVDAIKSYEKDDFLQTQFDRFHAFKAREAVAGPIPDEQSSYIAARMTTSAGQSADWAIENSGLKWDGSVLVPDDNVPSLFKVLEAAGGDARGFLGWKTAVRAERLLSEGKENNFTADDIKAGLKLNEGREAEFDDAFTKYAEFSKNLVDIGEYGGIIDPTTRAVWENPDYIPFLRDNPDAGSSGVTSGPANQRSPIKKLHGGKEVMKDPLESIISGTYQMIDAAMNNRAALLAVDNLGHMGGIEDVTAQYKQAIIPMPQLKKILEDRGMSKQQIAQMPKEVFEGMQKVMSIVPPTGPDVIRVLRDGKPEYYRVTDPLLMRAFTGFESRESNMAMNVARATKRVLTWGVTKMPDFIVRNNARDTTTSYLVHPDQMLPGLRAAKGALGTLMNDKLNQTMMASGGGFGDGRFDVRDPGASNRQMRALLKRRGMKPFEIKHFMSSLLNTPGKLWNAYSSLNKASENANRYARAKYHLDKGDSMTRAMFEAKDMLDFSMQGDGKLMLFLADTVPFFNARIQGQYKLARAGAIPGLGMKRRVAAKAFMMAMASTAYIWSIMNDPEKKKLYDALPEWDRLGSYHFWGAKGEDGQRAHWRIPRPFEAGFLFGTIPEEFYLSLSKNAEWKEGIQHIGQGISSQLGFNPIGQAVRPLYDAARNEDTFSHRQIESFGDAGRDPADRYDDRTSPIAKAIAKPFSEGLTAAIRTVNPDSEATGISPKKLEYLFDQYTGGFGQWALDRADKMVRTAMSDKESTVGEKLSAVLGNAPVPGEPSPNGAHPLLSIGKIYKSDNGTEYSRYDEEFSNLSKLADAAQRRINQLREEGSDEEAASKQDEKKGLLQFRPQIAKDKKRIKGLYKQADDIRADDKLTSDEKRDKINVLLRERERIVKASYLRYKVSSGTARINEDSSLSPSEKATAIKNLEDHYKSLED